MQRGSQVYHETRVLTASPAHLQLMLYDGALRWCANARLAMAAGDREAACLTVERARLITLYLMEGLRPEVAPELCALVASAYQFIFGRLVEAGLHLDIEALDEAIGVFTELRSAWAELLQVSSVKCQVPSDAWHQDSTSFGTYRVSLAT